MRYDEIDSTLDRETALSVADASLDWARALFDAARAQPPHSPGPDTEPPEA